MIPHMRELFDVQVGLSDHTMGIGAAARRPWRNRYRKHICQDAPMAGGFAFS
jgi:sialic acid synthase SpsE